MVQQGQDRTHAAQSDAITKETERIFYIVPIKMVKSMTIYSPTSSKSRPCGTKGQHIASAMWYYHSALIGLANHNLLIMWTDNMLFMHVNT